MFGGSKGGIVAFGEAFHKSSEILGKRNEIIKSLVVNKEIGTIAIESCFRRSLAVNRFVLNDAQNSNSFGDIKQSGFSHNFGDSKENEELIMWLKEYNTTTNNQIYFYGFDAPMEMTHTESPRPLFQIILQYITTIDEERAKQIETKIAPLLGVDADWENPEAMMDPSKSIGNSPSAQSLRIEIDNLIIELETQRPTWAQTPDQEERYEEAIHLSQILRILLGYHAEAAAQNPSRTSRMLAIRDYMMAENVKYLYQRERKRNGENSKVFLFAHNHHLKKGIASWQLGPQLVEWWPAGSHLSSLFGERYYVVGSAVGSSDCFQISAPEEGSVEYFLGKKFEESLIVEGDCGNSTKWFNVSASFPSSFEVMRNNHCNNYTYFPLHNRDFRIDFDAILYFSTITQ